MNNLSSYCGLVDAKIRASYKDLPVEIKQDKAAYAGFSRNVSFSNNLKKIAG